ncbi:hypothetical protein [Stenotrophomonas acidaminiphila]
MMNKERLLTLKEMEVIAKKATHDALMSYPRLEGSDSENLTLGTQLADEEGIFELYIAGERPLDAKVISCTRVDRRTGEVSVEVFIDKPS